MHLLEIAGLCNFEFFENTYPWVYRTRNRAIFSTSRRLFHVLAISDRQITQCNIHCLADIEWKKSLGPVEPFMRMPHKSHYFELRMKGSTFEPLGVMSQIRGASLVASPVHKQSCALDVIAEVAGSAELVRNWRSHLSCTWCWMDGCKVPFFLFSYSIPMCPCTKIRLNASILWGGGGWGWVLWKKTQYTFGFSLADNEVNEESPIFGRTSFPLLSKLHMKHISIGKVWGSTRRNFLIRLYLKLWPEYSKKLRKNK